jgi:hypothetical protein
MSRQNSWQEAQKMNTAFTTLVRSISQLFRGRRPGKNELARVRFAMIEQVLDCNLRTVSRVRKAIESARTMMHLWLLRSEIFQAVSERFGQSEAMRRMALLAPYFETMPHSRPMRLAA